MIIHISLDNPAIEPPVLFDVGVGVGWSELPMGVKTAW